jgi:hypothetical protein
MIVETNHRIFQRISLPRHGMHPPSGMPKRLVGQSSGINSNYPDAKPGNCYLWIGDDFELNREQIAELVEHLEAWLKTGSLRING